MRDAAGAAAAASFEDTGEFSRKYSIGREQKDRAAEERRRLQTIVGSRAGSVFDDSDEITHVGSRTVAETASAAGGKESESVHLVQEGSQIASLPRRIALGVLDFVLSLFTPPTIALISGLVIALVTKLKVLFVAVTDGTFHPTAPVSTLRHFGVGGARSADPLARLKDGDPPLAIILDTMSFLGAASVPLGLLVLGAALARMRLPRPISRLPLASIFGLAIAKLVILPVIGFLFVHALTFHTSTVPPSNKVLRFVRRHPIPHTLQDSKQLTGGEYQVLIYFSCVPTVRPPGSTLRTSSADAAELWQATTQVALTQVPRRAQLVYFEAHQVICSDLRSGRRREQ